MKTITIFTKEHCLFCQMLKKKLTDQLIPFRDVDVKKNPELWAQVFEQTGNRSLPTVFIKDESDDTGTVYVPGRDFQNDNELIEIIKSNI